MIKTAALWEQSLQKLIVKESFFILLSLSFPSRFLLKE